MMLDPEVRFSDEWLDLRVRPFNDRIRAVAGDSEAIGAVLDEARASLSEPEFGALDYVRRARARHARTERANLIWQLASNIEWFSVGLDKDWDAETHASIRTEVLTLAELEYALFMAYCAALITEARFRNDSASAVAIEASLVEFTATRRAHGSSS